jgi:hypothetical protein
MTGQPCRHAPVLRPRSPHAHSTAACLRCHRCTAGRVTDRPDATASVKSPRIYVFDNGTLSGLDPKQYFGFERSELKAVDFTAQSY